MRHNMMQFLLDTNILLWYFWGADRVNSIKAIVTSEEADIFVSAVSFWEIMIKLKTGKLTVDVEQLRLFAKSNAFFELPITGDYIKTYLELPQLHKDPFDRMLLAQAITHPMRLITSDSLLAEYSSLVMVV